jgi:hypothetical protein
MPSGVAQSNGEGAPDWQLEFESSEEDVRAFVRYTMHRRFPGVLLLVAMRLVFVYQAVVTALSLRPTGPVSWMIAIALSAGLLVLAWKIPAWLLDVGVALNPNPGGHAVPGTWTVASTATGLAHRHPDGEGSVPWDGIREVVSTPKGLYVFVSRREALVIPAHAFASAEEMGEFAAEVERRRREAGA